MPVLERERCNSQKRGHTQVEVGMQLRTKPKPPVHPAVAFAFSETWRESATKFWIDVQANLE
jgi:hypothetical protein